MAKNYVQDGKVLDLTIADVSAGDPVAVGEIIGVALTDTDSDGKVRVQTEGVFKLSVTAQAWDSVDSEYVDSAINVGDALYYDGGTINKNDTKTLFGYALESVAAGATATIKVKLAEK